MALESVLDDTPGGGGLVIWLHYPTLYETAEWFLDYYHNVWMMDTAQSDALDELFVHKKGWEGVGADQYKLLYDTFLEKLYRPCFETRLSSIKGTTVDAVVGAGKLINQCDDFYLSLESDDYEPEIRMGRSCDSSGILKYDCYYKDAILNHCDAANTATTEEDELLDEAIEAVANVNYPQFVMALNGFGEKKEAFIKKQKRILNYKNTFSDYVQRVVRYDEEVADAYNAQVDEELVEDVEYTPIAVVPPWEVDCANLWTATGNYAAMIDFINSTPKDANVWTEGTAQAMAIIYQDAVENNNAEVKQAFDNRFQKITYKQTTGTKVVCSNTSATSFNGVEWVTYDNYTYETDPAVIRRMEPYMDIYLNGKAWTSLHETISVSIEQGSNEASERNTTISVTKDTDGNLVTTVSLTDADGNTVISKSVTAYNIWDKMYEEGKLKEMRLAGKTQAQIDEYRQSEQGKLDLYTNPNYKLSQEEEEEARELIDQFWDEHPDLNGIRENGDLKDFYKSYKGEEELTFEEYLRANDIDDMDTYNQAVQYYKLEHKLSNADAFWNGVTEVPYNIGKASESLIDKMCGDSNLSDLYGYDEHDLEIQALCEQQKEDRDLARKASELQNPYAYGAGRASYMLVTSAVAGELLGGTGLVESTASILGGGKAAEKIAEVVLDTVLVDIPTDTVPELIVNLNNGMSKGEALENALKNVAENAVINVGADVVLPEVFGAVAKSFDDAGTVKVIGDESEDMLKSSSDSFKIADGNATHNVSSDVVDNLFGEKARNHIETVEGFNKKKGGIIGGHTEEAFKSFSERPVNILSKNKIGDGIYEYTYQVGTLERGVAKTNPDGSFVWYGDTYTKTVINTEELSVDSFEKMAKDAFSKEVIYETESGQLYIKGVMDNGVKVEGYIDKATMELKSYYPCIKYNDNIKIKGEYKYE